MFEFVFNQLSEPRIILKNDAPHYTVVAINAAYKLFSPEAARSAIGQSLWTAFGPNSYSRQNTEQLRNALEQVTATFESLKLPPSYFNRKATDGTLQQVWWEVELNPFTDSQLHQQYILCTIWDITERVESNKARERYDRVQNMLLGIQERISEDLEIATEQVTTITEAKEQLERTAAELRKTNSDLQQAQRLLEQAISTAQMGSWSMDLRTKELHMSPRTREMFSLPPEGPILFEEALSAVDPAYQETAIQVLESGIREQKDVMVEYPLVNRHTGKRIWVKGTGRMFFGPDGFPSHFSGLFVDITEQKAEEERRNTFIAIVSHELKTPLTAAKGYLQLLQRQLDGSTSELGAHLLSKTIEQTEKMNRLIGAYLSSARLEAGKIQLDLSNFSLNELVEEIIIEQRQINHFPDIHFEACESRMIRADREKIGQVISNFIGNAIKYSPQKGKVTVSCDYSDDTAAVIVADEGIGISSADQQHIFERFYRVGQIPSPPLGSFGIGLYLCAEIVHRHKGEIKVESKPGKGSVFKLKIPLEPVNK